MTVLIMTRYGKHIKSTHASIKSAAHTACKDIETNEAAPVSIKEDGIIVWQNTGPLDGSYDKLRELAGLEGVVTTENER